jgi:hypothetical protein
MSGKTAGKLIGRMPRRITAAAGGLTVLLTTAALLAPGPATAGATTVNLFTLTPGGPLPTVPCGTQAEFATSPWGFQLPTSEAGSIVAGLNPPSWEAPIFLLDLKLLGSLLSDVLLPAQGCGGGTATE